MQRNRIFIAINLPSDIKKKLTEYQRKIAENFEEINPDLNPVRWTFQENLHITLIFLGYLTDQELIQVCATTKEVAQKHEPFSLMIRKIVYAPPQKKTPRMVWAKGENSSQLALLQQELENALFERDEREEKSKIYAPHITLGRIRQWQFKKIDPDERPGINEELSLNFLVSSIEIMESELKRRGPEYTILESISFKE